MSALPLPEPFAAALAEGLALLTSPRSLAARVLASEGGLAPRAFDGPEEAVHPLLRG